MDVNKKPEQHPNVTLTSILDNKKMTITQTEPAERTINLYV